jgi:hypothetical protein
MSAARTAGGGTAAAGRSSGFGDCMATAPFADETAGRHELADMSAIADRAIRLLATENQTFEILVAVFAMIFIYRHSYLLELFRTAPLYRTAGSGSGVNGHCHIAYQLAERVTACAKRFSNTLSQCPLEVL